MLKKNTHMNLFSLQSMILFWNSLDKMCVSLPSIHTSLIATWLEFTTVSSSVTWMVPPPRLCPLSALHSRPLITQPRYWWKVITGKWLPTKAPHSLVSDSAGSCRKAWLACQLLRTPVKHFLCLSLGPAFCSISPSMCYSDRFLLFGPTSTLVCCMSRFWLAH